MHILYTVIYLVIYMYYFIVQRFEHLHVIALYKLNIIIIIMTTLSVGLARKTSYDLASVKEESRGKYIKPLCS